MGIIGIHHVSMKCSKNEYNMVVDFYKRLLGLSVYKEWPTGVLLNTGNGYLEIFNDGEVLPKGVIRHFAFQVNGIDEMINNLRINGVNVFIEPKNVNLNGLEARIAFIYGPLGEEVELFEVFDD